MRNRIRAVGLVILTRSVEISPDNQAGRGRTTPKRPLSRPPVDQWASSRGGRLRRMNPKAVRTNKLSDYGSGPKIVPL
ncbi:hypothetical protein GWI33_008975 [Rhynchophorus ferrugineus]|uniref:Uncharacterized protein n=1 Tax=Rhynchophorus ferrugineus TaxID=354439 RepID=A0A834MAP0_RHYFE|nr:hypothetical protein GWI33_008975 [Rhynchophorus ferrugineus]